jgi:hypothetical protein
MGQERKITFPEKTEITARVGLSNAQERDLCNLET